MSKKPHSVYVDEVVHSRLAQMIEYATGGAGSLGGFFAQLEVKTYDELGPHPKHPHVRAFFDALAGGPYRRSEWFARDMSPQSRDPFGSSEFSAYCNTPLSDVAAYAEAWRRFHETLPWPDPDIAHILALRLLSARDGLWQPKPPVANDVPLNQTIESGYVHEILDNLRSAGLGLQPGSPYFTAGFFPIAWRRGRVDLFPRDEEPKLAPASLYLDQDAHKFFYAVFGNRFYTVAEAKLDRLLSDSRNWVDISSESQFLEHGSDLIELEEIYFEPESGDDRPELDKPFWLTDVSGLLGWRINRFPTDRIAHRIGLSRSRGARPDANRLERTFLDAYGLSTLEPDTRSTYRLITKHLEEVTDSMAFQDPVELHLFQLLQSYVTSTLPPSEREPMRVALPVLATMGQSWALPTTRALEAYSGARATKLPTGHWELQRSRELVASMSNAEAYHTMWALWSCIPPMVSYQKSFNDLFVAVSGYDHWLEALAGDDVELERSLRARRKHSFDTGPAVIADLLACLRRGDHHPTPEFHWVNHPCTTYLQQRIAEVIKLARS